MNSDTLSNTAGPIAMGSPARDNRFVVVDRWVECAQFAPDDPSRHIEFFHRQMNEEVNSLECSALNISDFTNQDWALRMALARQCFDEARHAAMFRGIFESRGGAIGQYPVLNFQFRIISSIKSLVGRLAVQNRSFEAGGLDAIKYGIDDANERGDQTLVDLYQSQQADEINHVRFANEAIRAETERNPRALLLIGAALHNASKAFFEVMGVEGTTGVRFPADVNGRIEAGFSDREVQTAIDLQKPPDRAAAV